MWHTGNWKGIPVLYMTATGTTYKGNAIGDTLVVDCSQSQTMRVARAAYMCIALITNLQSVICFICFYPVGYFYLNIRFDTVHRMLHDSHWQSSGFLPALNKARLLGIQLRVDMY